MATRLEEQLEFIKNQKAILENKRELAAAEEKEIKRLEQRAAALRAAGDADEELEARLERRLQLHVEHERAIKAEAEALAELEERQKALTAASQAGEAAREQMFQGFLKTDGAFGGFLDKLQKAAGAGPGGLQNFTSEMFSAKGGLKLLEQVGKKTLHMFVEFGMQQDKVLANFRAQTGAGDEFNEVIRSSALDNIALGVTLEETAGAVRELKNEYTDFTYLNEQQQRALTNTTTTLNKLGMSFSTQASIMQTATQAMGMDVKQANNLLVDLASTAQSLGVDIEKLGQQFAQNAEFLVRFGEDGQRVFEDLAVTAKALGTEMGTLVKMTEKFKTFDDAGRAVGRFNAILGGPYLNSIDMLNAAYEDPIEGIKMLREGFDQAGKSVEDLSGAELEAFASALGLSTKETVELLGKSNEELDIQRKTQEEMAEAARAAQPVLDQLSMAFKTLLADGKPLIDIMVVVLKKVGEFAGFIGKAENAAARFLKIGLAIAGIAALIAAPFTMGTSLTAFGAIAGSLGVGAVGGGIAALAGASGGGGGGGATPHFRTGGTVTTEQAVVHPDEILITGGQGSEVISQKDFKELLDGLKKLADGAGPAAPSQVAVYVGQKKIDEVVVDALNSPAGRKVMTPYSMV